MKKKRELFMYVAGGIILLAFLTLTIYGNIADTPTTGDFNSALLTIVALIVGYYWGSSQGSADKTDIMNKPPEIM